MKIYFAGSITGGRQDQGIYVEIINLLKSYGEVLTEHIADVAITDKGENLSVQEIYQRDIDWLESSDIVVAEVTAISLGVGYELGVAEKLGKKVICLYRPAEKRLSAMISGNHNFIVHPYQNVSELKSIFDSELSNGN